MSVIFKLWATIIIMGLTIRKWRKQYMKLLKQCCSHILSEHQAGIVSKFEEVSQRLSQLLDMVAARLVQVLKRGPM